MDGKTRKISFGFHKKIDGLINEMKNHGCIAAKLIGAGGGGYILAFC